MIKVKICGITNLEDALFAASCGADALGFNFYAKSPRYVSPENAAEIARELPENVKKVGVFVNENIDNIIEIARMAGLNAIQLHGDETPAFIATMKGATEFEIIKALRVSEDFTPEKIMAYKADTILLDSYSKNDYGGTGDTFNWDLALQTQKLFPKMYLAGGLSPENVGEAVKTVSPFAVDACSLLEREKGLKDHDKVAAFIQAAKGD